MSTFKEINQNFTTPVPKQGSFRVGLTQEQAKAENLTDLFNTYNTKKDNVIDEAEFKIYQKNLTPAKQQTKIGLQSAAAGGAIGTVVNTTGQKVSSLAKGIVKKTKGSLEDINEESQNVRQQTQSEREAVNNIEITGSQSAGTNIQEQIDSTDNSSESIENTAQDINKSIEADLDETNENSLVNKLSNRYKSKNFKKEELKFLEERGIDPNNLSDEDCKTLAREMIMLKYTIDMTDSILDAIENNDAEAFAKSAQILMKTNCNTADLANAIMVMANRAGKSFSEEQIRSMVNTYAETYQHEEGVDQELEEIAVTDVMTYADEEYINILYQNNAQMIDRLNEIAQNVANNTTDETRKSMLNNVVKNSAEISKNSPNNPNTENDKNPQNQNIKNSVTPNAPPVSNPIQNSAQVNYVNDLKQQALAFQNQFVNNTDNNTIPEKLNHTFSTLREYRSFTGTGMTLLEYQETKSTLKNNFTSAIKEIVKDYTTMPDMFKTKVLTLCDSLDDDILGGLFINGDQDVRHFMYKYNYMNDNKLMAFAERKPAEFKNATPQMKKMLEDIKNNQTQTV